jgi:YVTN family beta-propeller protein
MEFRVLGPLEVVDEGRALRLGSGKQVALVAYLLLHANEAVSVDRLVDELWDETPPPTAAKIVRNYVSLLRRELGDRLVTQSPGYLLRVVDGELDSRQLERAVTSGDLESLNRALALWRGSPLAQVAYEPFAQSEIARLEELRLTAIEARVDAQLELGRHTEVVAELESLVRENPLRERLRGQLMLALYRSGRQADALATYQDARRTLDRELGIEPSPALRELERKILNHDASLSAPAPAPPSREPSGARRRRTPALIALGALVLLAAAAAAALLATQESAAIVEVPPNSVGVIDPERNATVAAVPVGVRPDAVTVGEGSVWVANLEDRNLARINPQEFVAEPDVSLEDRTPTGLAVDFGAVWVVHGRSGELSRVDPEFGVVTDTAVVAGGRPLGGSVTTGHGYVWAVYGDSTLARIVPATTRNSGSSLTGPTPIGVVYGERDLWVANAGDSTVQRFEPITFGEGQIDRIPAGARPSAIAYGENALWVANRDHDTVRLIDPRTGGTQDIAVGDAPVGVAVGEGAVWVANSGSGTVSRIDPESRIVVETIEVGGRPAGIATGEGYVWVTVQEP